MVLGYILDESAELMWNLGCMTYRGSKSIYNRYYAVPTPDEVERTKLEEISEKLEHLEALLEKKDT
tara:strand:- start:229 stop:426 length:198 start_codon:yes stop_codon:yes gene_type:complete